MFKIYNPEIDFFKRKKTCEYDEKMRVEQMNMNG